MSELFKVIVAGGRYFNQFHTALLKLNSILADKKDIEIVSGACDTGLVTFVREDGTNVCGADGIGEKYAKRRKLPVKYFPADWSKHGKAAGPIRNREMGEYAKDGGAVIFWDGFSKGTKSIIDIATELGLKLRVIMYDPKNKKQ